MPVDLLPACRLAQRKHRYDLEDLSVRNCLVEGTEVMLPNCELGAVDTFVAVLQEAFVGRAMARCRVDSLVAATVY